MDVSSFYQTMTSFTRLDVLKMCRHAALDAFPGLPLAGSLVEIFLQSHPQLLRNDNLDDADGEDFILTDSKECIEKFVDLYLKQRVEIVAPSKELQASTQENFKLQCIDAIGQRIQKIEKIAHDFGIKKVAFGCSLSVDLPSPDSVETPYAALGNQCSYLSEPMIIFTPPRLKIVVDPSIPTPTEDFVAAQKEKNNKIKDFFTAHEMVHIAKNHTLISTISYLAFSILATGIWVKGLQDGLSLTPLALTYGKVFGSAALFELFFYTVRRCQEKEADLGAIKYLETNEGAMAGLESFAERVPFIELEHPPIPERLAYVQAKKLD